MNVKVVYPAKNVKSDLRRNTIYWAKPLFILAGVVTAIVNIIVKGSAWSVIVIWSLWMVWSFIFNPTLIEHNRTSIAVKSSIQVTILIVIIYLIYPNWPGIEVASLVVVAGLLLTATLFFSNVSRQKQNVFPMLIFVLIAIAFSVVSFILRGDRPLGWAMIVAISVACAIFLSTSIILRINYFREIKKRFML